MNNISWNGNHIFPFSEIQNFSSVQLFEFDNIQFFPKNKIHKIKLGILTSQNENIWHNTMHFYLKLIPDRAYSHEICNRILNCSQYQFLLTLMKEDKALEIHKKQAFFSYVHVFKAVNLVDLLKTTTSFPYFDCLIYGAKSPIKCHFLKWLIFYNSGSFVPKTLLASIKCYSLILEKEMHFQFIFQEKSL